MSMNFGPGAAANTNRLLRLLRRPAGAPRPAPALPGEPTMADQIASLGVQVDPRLLPQPEPVRPMLLPSGPGPSAGPPIAFTPPPSLDPVGQEPAARLAAMADMPEQAAQATQAQAGGMLARPAPLQLTERKYSFPDPAAAPTLAPAPVRDLRKESRQALRQSLLPAGLGLLLGGAPAALAGLQGTMAGAKTRADQEAAQELQQWGQQRQDAMADYGFRRQDVADRLGRVGQQIRADSALDANMVKAKGDEWDAYTREMDRLQKAFDAAENREQKEQIALLMDETRRQGQAIQAVLGTGRLEDQQKRTGIMGNMFGLRKDDILADNKRADKAQEMEQWYRTRQLGIAQGRLNLAQEKASITSGLKGVKTWTDAQAKIADLNAKGARLSEGNPLLGEPPTEEEQMAASMHFAAGRDLANKFGMSWNSESRKWEKVKAPTKAAPTGYDAALRGGGYSGASVNPAVVSLGSPRLTPTPIPSVKTMEGRGIKPVVNPQAQSGNRPTATPKPSATPKPLDKMTPEEKLAELAKIGAKGLK